MRINGKSYISAADFSNRSIFFKFPMIEYLTNFKLFFKIIIL